MITHDEDLPAALAGDLDGHFEALVLAFQDRLYAFALRLTSSPRDAEEIVQDAFVSAYRALARYPAERVRSMALRAWLYQITLNVLRNRTRRARLREEPLDGAGASAHLERLADTHDGPEASLLYRERSGELAALLAALPPRYRTAVVLRHVAGLGYGEIAAIVGQPAGTVKSNVHRGIGLLRDRLSQPEHERLSQSEEVGAR